LRREVRRVNVCNDAAGLHDDKRVGRGFLERVGDGYFSFAERKFLIKHIWRIDGRLLGKARGCRDARGRNQLGDMAKRPGTPRRLAPVTQSNIAARKAVMGLEG
jgi:hypothetical protein